MDRRSFIKTTGASIVALLAPLNFLRPKAKTLNTDSFNASITISRPGSEIPSSVEITTSDGIRWYIEMYDFKLTVSEG